MVIMALDHVRDLMHVHAGTQNPTDLSSTTPMLFFTRWITHLCAPIFVFLAGTSAYISFKNKGNIRESRRFLLTRGLWLILLEFTFVNFGIFFDLGFHNFFFEVIAAIGFGFIILGLLLKATVKTIAVTGLVILFCHDLLAIIPFSDGSIVKTVLSPLLAPGAFSITPATNFVIAYPPVPWLGIMLTGFASGKLFDLPGDKRKNLFLKIGSAAVLLFIVLRVINIYGDPFPWASKKDALFTFLSFINITKYPPSLLFCLVTLGLMFFILAFAEQVKNRFTDIALVYGKVPLFYFLVHFYLIHVLLIVLLFLQGFHWADLNFASGNFGRPKGAESGVGLPAVYAIWGAIVLALYKPCLWFGKYKITHTQWWLKYI